MDTDTANITMKFMERVQLQGNEVGAFVKVMNALNEIASFQPETMTPATKKAPTAKNVPTKAA